MPAKIYFNIFLVKHIVNRSLATILVAFMSLFAFAQPGMRDNNFGTGGEVFLESYRARVDVMAVQKDGKIITAGNYASGEGVHVTRFNTNGSLDLEFGNEGHFYVHNLPGGQYVAAKSLLLQADDKILGNYILI